MEYLSKESDAWVAMLLRHYTNMERQSSMVVSPAFYGEQERVKLVVLTAEALRRSLPLPVPTGGLRADAGRA